jgi:hypothetical protein
VNVVITEGTQLRLSYIVPLKKRGVKIQVVERFAESLLGILSKFVMFLNSNERNGISLYYFHTILKKNLSRICFGRVPCRAE